MKTTLYETKPLEYEPKLKELRRKYFWNIWQAQDRGDLLIMGAWPGMNSLPAGLGDYATLGGGPNFGKVMDSPELMRKCVEEMDSRGYRSDVCSSHRTELGAMYLGLQNVSPSGKRYTPDFILESVGGCETAGKPFRLFVEYHKVPYFTYEQPHVSHRSDVEAEIAYLVPQLHECVEWMEKVTGRQYDDDKLIQAVNNEWRTKVLYARVCELNKNIPAPLDLGHHADLLRLYLRTGAHREEIADFMQMVLDETQDRVNEGISASERETSRWLHENNCPWFYDLLTFPHKYGALFVGSGTYFTVPGAFIAHEDGTWEAAKTPQERGIELRTRDGALRSLAELTLGARGFDIFGLLKKLKGTVRLAEDWHADAVVFHEDRGCRAITAGQLEIAAALKERGIPTFTYEGSRSDPRDFDQGQVVRRLEAFAESLGLTQLEG